MRAFAEILANIGVILFFVTYVWSFVIGYRTGVAWLLGLLLVWIFVYPALVIKTWPKARANFFTLLLSLTIIAVSVVMLIQTNPNRIST